MRLNQHTPAGVCASMCSCFAGREQKKNIKYDIMHALFRNLLNLFRSVIRPLELQLIVCVINVTLVYQYKGFTRSSYYQHPTSCQLDITN